MFYVVGGIPVKSYIPSFNWLENNQEVDTKYKSFFFITIIIFFFGENEFYSLMFHGSSYNRLYLFLPSLYFILLRDYVDKSLLKMDGYHAKY